ncbi:MAG: hypothetical protein LUE11_01200 [Clostridia bacterium]|nr:hypothetical protein [Clostridia bacterium]
MADTDEKEKNYTVKRIENENVTEPDRKLEQDPLDHLPDVSSQTGGLPIVTFVLICLAACAMILMSKVITAGSVLVSVVCVLIIAILVFGMIALIRGMFTKLHNQNEKERWYPISSIIMAAGILAGLIIGIFASF